MNTPSIAPSRTRPRSSRTRATSARRRAAPETAASAFDRPSWTAREGRFYTRAEALQEAEAEEGTSAQVS